MERRELTKFELKVTAYIVSRLGEIPGELTYYKVVGGYGGVVKYRGRLFRMPEPANGGINASQIGILASAGLIKVIRVPNNHRWGRLYWTHAPLPVFGRLNQWHFNS